MNTIPNFKESHRFLSNFWWAKVKLDGIIYPSTEHAYQAAKTLVPAERDKIRLAKSFNEAKHLGYSVTLRPNWDKMKNEIMFDLVLQKFRNYPLLRASLLQTGDAELIEGNTWHDIYWGVCNCPDHKGVGENHLGKILMAARKHLREEAKSQKIL